MGFVTRQSGSKKDISRVVGPENDLKAKLGRALTRIIRILASATTLYS